MLETHSNGVRSYGPNRSFPYWGIGSGSVDPGCTAGDFRQLCSRHFRYRAGYSNGNYSHTCYGHCRLERHDSTICSRSSIQTTIDARTGPVRQINSAKLQNQRRSYRGSNNVHKYFMLATTGGFSRPRPSSSAHTNEIRR